MNNLPIQIPLLIAAASLALAPALRAVTPPPDGGYPNKITAEGEDALLNLTTGTDNTALGFNALLSTTEAGYNTAVGSQALASTTTGNSNVAIGAQALFSNTTGGINIAAGYLALYSNISGGGNLALGETALYANKSGSNNIALGVAALVGNTTGISNAATGMQAMFRNTTGSHNCAYGEAALALNETADSNTAMGDHALFDNLTGTNNIAIGAYAGLDINGDNNIDIGHPGASGDSGVIRIGRPHNRATYIAGISNTTVGDGSTVVVNAKGRLGVLTSSARFKEAIQPMAQASEAILSLQPVTFRYKHELDPAGIPQFGLVAEQVERVNPDLVARDDQGKPYTVRYEAVNAMLLNEFLKEHRKVEEQAQRQKELEATVAQQQSTNAEQQKEIQALMASLREQAKRIQNVSDQLETSKSTPRVVAER